MMRLIRKLFNFFSLFGGCVLYITVLFPWSSEAIGFQQRHAAYAHKFHKEYHFQPITVKTICGTEECTMTTTESIPTTILPDIFTPIEDSYMTTDLPMTTIFTPIESSETEINKNSQESIESRSHEHQSLAVPGAVSFVELNKLLRLKRKECRQLELGFQKKVGLNSFTCQKIKLSWWLLEELEKNSTYLWDSYVKLVKNTRVSQTTHESELMPESGTENLVFRLINSFGEPVDKLLFYQFKKYTKSRELQVSIPKLMELQISPRTHPQGVTGRTLFDPGFNLKLKFPFFHDELKVAVSTGPSFLAGLGVGLVVLGIKSIFAPFVLAMKAIILSWFFKDISPMEMVKTLAAPMLPTWVTGFRPQPEAHYSGWEQSVEHYEPPHVQNSYETWGSGQEKKNTGIMGALTHLIPFTSHDQTNQFTQTNPSFQNPRPFQGGYPSSGGYNRPNVYANGEGRTQPLRHTGIDEDSGSEHTVGYESNDPPEQPLNYIPSTTLQHQDDNYDSFYSPLLSRIDSIFMHLGFSEEGCKERAVCSIYKYPVKYAPYSNLLSAQLSKHQSELKRPMNTSPKILRYFKYMKAAKDGQAALNCLDLYPNCTNDTEKLTNLPMVKTFQQLTELMGTGPSG